MQILIFYLIFFIFWIFGKMEQFWKFEFVNECYGCCEWIDKNKYEYFVELIRIFKIINDNMVVCSIIWWFVCLLYK